MMKKKGFTRKSRDLNSINYILNFCQLIFTNNLFQMKTGKVTLKPKLRKNGFTARVLQKNKRLNELQNDALELKTILDDNKNKMLTPIFHKISNLVHYVFSLIDKLIPEGKFGTKLDITCSELFGYENLFTILALQKQNVITHLTNSDPIPIFRDNMSKTLREISRILLRQPFFLIRRQLKYTTNVEAYLETKSSELARTKPEDQKDDDKNVIIQNLVESYGKFLNQKNEPKDLIQVQANVIFGALQILF